MKVVLHDPDTGYLDRYLWVPKRLIDISGTKHALTYEITEKYGRQRTQLLFLWKESEHHLLVPRTFWDTSRLACRVIDCRPRAYPVVEFKSRIKLDHRLKEINGKKILMPTGESLQERSLSAMQSASGGILQLACGKGKTVITLELIARGRVPALVLVDNTNLLAQWKEEAESLLDIPGGIGIFGAGKKEWKKGLVLATYHSIANWSESIPEEARRWFGIIVSDEAHHVSAPMFSKTADMFYGARYGLTATPERSDGLHVLCDGHIGPVLFKDLTPTMKPSFGFYWTGLSLNLSDPTTASKVLDINGEVHLSKLTAYNGQWPERMRVVLQAVSEAYAVGRMVLVLANSVDEVMNLASCWERPGQPLYTDIPIPTPGEVGEQMHPLELSPQEVEKVNRKIAHYEEQHKRSTNATAREQLQAALTRLRQQLKQHEVARKIDNELKRRQRTYVAQLIRDTKTAGMLSYEVPTATREKFLKERMVIFSIMKYGKEGMNCQRLDTVILSSLFSDANGLKQLIGRPTRPLPGKKTPVLLAIVDNIGPVIGMARKLMNHLRDWPHEEGGPYDPILIGFPESWRTRHKFPTTSLLFGQS